MDSGALSGEAPVMRVAVPRTGVRVESHSIAGDGVFPGSPYPARIYRGVLDASATDRAAAFEALFAEHGWPPAWRAGLYEMHHYHGSAHEVLGVYSGWVNARLGGPGGVAVSLRAGDVVLIPAGVAHCNEGQSPDFLAVGAYPEGMSPDMRYGHARERADAQRLAALPPPMPDPVFGVSGAP
jgi:uncharacterized protein YjlB